MKPLILLCCFLITASGNPTIEGSLGKFTGKLESTIGVKFESFLGIPYAKPPIGELRFALPAPFGEIGDFNATKYSPKCPQVVRSGWSNHPQDEDCLYLNIYRKHKPVRRCKKAVIVILHGGGYSFGSSADMQFDAAPLAAVEDVVIVSLNYRLGVLGFADMGGFAPGNLGLHDQRLALQWIQDNIADFGGDPNRVTVMGTSAGAMSVGAQLLTIIDRKELFQTAIMDGGVLMSNGFYEDPQSSFTRIKKIAKHVRCPVDSSQMVDCLRKASLDDLIPLSVDRSGTNGILSFVPTTDGIFLPRDLENFLDDHPGEIRKVRLLIGYAQDEGTMFATSNDTEFDFKTKKRKDEAMDYFAEVSTKYNLPLDFNKEDIRDLVEQYYLFENPDSLFNAMALFLGDGIFKCPINDFIRSYSRYSDKIFVYQFEYKVQAPYFESLDPNVLGVFHYSPFMHFTGALFRGGAKIFPKDESFALETMHMISQFVKSDVKPTFRNDDWWSYSKLSQIFVIDDDPSIWRGLASEIPCKRVFPTKTMSKKAKSPKSEL